MTGKIFGIKFLAVIVGVAMASVGSFVFLQDSEANVVEYDGPPKAVIIDQLYDEMKNEEFHEEAIGYLEKAGYQVDVFTTKDITVDFFKNLPQMNYEFVVIRTHGVADFGNENSMLFTGETYSEEKYTAEQLLSHVKRATPVYSLSFQAADDSSEWVQINETTSILRSPIKIEDNTTNEFFAITPKFVKEVMKGQFRNTVFLLGGCSTLSSPSMAQALIQRGASAVAGWDDQISSAENDYTLIKILENIFEKNLDLDAAIDDSRSFFYGEFTENLPVEFLYYSQENI